MWCSAFSLLCELLIFSTLFTSLVVYGEYVPFAKSGLGYVLTPRDHFSSDDLDSSCCFRPLDPPLQIQYALVWKRYSVFSRAAEVFLEKVKLLLNL